MEERVMGNAKPRHCGVLTVVLLGLFIAAVPLRGEDEDTRLELEEIVVTGAAVSDPVTALPRNVTVITAFDIEQAPSKNIIDLLAREANVNLRSLFGHDKSAGIDIRGMGDTYGSTVVVMVDGFRINSPDMTGFDLSSVPLEAVERIEIVRGSQIIVDERNPCLPREPDPYGGRDAVVLDLNGAISAVGFVPGAFPNTATLRNLESRQMTHRPRGILKVQAQDIVRIAAIRQFQLRGHGRGRRRKEQHDRAEHPLTHHRLLMEMESSKPPYLRHPNCP